MKRQNRERWMREARKQEIEERRKEGGTKGRAREEQKGGRNERAERKGGRKRGRKRGRNDEEETEGNGKKGYGHARDEKEIRDKKTDMDKSDSNKGIFSALLFSSFTSILLCDREKPCVASFLSFFSSLSSHSLSYFTRLLCLSLSFSCFFTRPLCPLPLRPFSVPFLFLSPPSLMCWSLRSPHILQRSTDPSLYPVLKFLLSPSHPICLVLPPPPRETKPRHY